VQILGIDIGGSGIKGAIVDSKTGVRLTERFRVPTPQPAFPEEVGDAVAGIVRHFEWKGPIGCTFPAIIKKGIAHSAANIHPDWIGMDVARLIKRKTKCPVSVLNDADAAGLAEMKIGAGKKKKGVVMVLTFGTGIGSGLFVDGILVPNTEMGHLEFKGFKRVELWASNSARKNEDLDWIEWAKRINEYLAHLELLFSPDLFIAGGGVSNPQKVNYWLPFMDTEAPIVPAELGNNAGIVGAAMAAYEKVKRKKQKQKKRMKRLQKRTKKKK
jgi:polyphosphate glucokinase